MTYSGQTKLASAQIIPAQSEHGLDVLQVTLDMRNSAAPVAEQVMLTASLPAGDRTLLAVQEEAVLRAVLMLADSTWSHHQDRAAPQGASAADKLRFAFAMWERRLGAQK